MRKPSRSLRTSHEGMVTLARSAPSCARRGALIATAVWLGSAVWSCGAASAQGPPTSPVQQGEISGRPPLPPLYRSDPRIFDLTFRATLTTDMPPVDATLRGIFDVTDAPVILPFILQSTYSGVDPTSFRSRLWLDGIEDGSVASRSRLELDKPFAMGFAIFTINRFRGQSIRWEINYRTQTWSSRIDDRAAGNIAWPATWPPECNDALRPQTWIDSEHPIFSAFVERVSQGRVREVPPYYAAKDLIRHAIASLRVTGSGVRRHDGGVLNGMVLSLASTAAERGSGTEHDLVSVCIAVLRAAGIPARPVIGIDRNPINASNTMLLSWGEFFLPGAGWVPFDPMRMRGAALDRRNVRDAWTGLGTMDDLNRRIPLAFTYHPPASVISHEFPAVYGWDPRPSKSPPGTRQFITISTTSRGQGTPDPK